MALRIGINAQLLSADSGYRHAGISNYIYQILRNVPRSDPRNQYVAFVGDGRALTGLDSSNLTGAVSALPARIVPARILWEQCFQPLSLRARDADLVHCPMHVVPFLSGRRKVVTVHDLAFMAFPSVHKRWNRLYLTLFTRWSLTQAQGIIAVSESTRLELSRLLRVPASRVTVVHNGVDSRFRPVQSSEALQTFRDRLGLPARFILFLGTLEPRKNVSTLVRAFAMARANLPEGVKLVLAGGKGWGYEGVFQVVEELGLEADVLFPGFVPDVDLPLLYSAAEVFAYPSLYEGFGLPPLEAMACGTPVVVSNASSLPEVVGDAGLLVDPQDPEALARSMVKVVDDPGLRADLTKRGIERAGLFSWQKTAVETIAVYREAMSS